jgi:hypothetical protein
MVRFYLILGIICSSWAWAENTSYYLSPEAQAMGNALTAIASDDQALFYNPAALAEVKNWSLRPIALTLVGSSDLLKTGQSLSSLKNATINDLNSFLNKNLYAQAQVTSSFVMPGFGIALINHDDARLHLQNPSFPQGYLGYQAIQGVQVGFGTKMLSFDQRKGVLNFGMAAKVLRQKGSIISITLTDVMTTDPSALLNQVNSDGSTGYGLDLGFQGIYRLTKRLKLLTSLSYTDIGNTSFRTTALEGSFTGGMALQYRSRDAVTTLAYDYSNILDNLDWRKKNHFGLRLQLDWLSFLVGINQIYFTYGLAVKFGLVQLMYASYAEAWGPLVHQNPQRNQVLQASLKITW